MDDTTKTLTSENKNLASEYDVLRARMDQIIRLIEINDKKIADLCEHDYYSENTYEGTIHICRICGHYR